MNRESIVIIVALLLFSCKATKDVSTTKKALYEIITTKNDGGANIKFYEIISESQEINMLLGDASLRKLIKKEDIQTCNYLILNLGPLPVGNYNSIIQKVAETPENIIIKVKELKTKASDVSDENTVYPYSVIKINSKKPIVIE
jgi:hypothetical protein